jgi:hypothetical protein
VEKAHIIEEEALANREQGLASAVLTAELPMKPEPGVVDKPPRRSAPQDGSILDGFGRGIHQPAQMNST